MEIHCHIYTCNNLSYQQLLLLRLLVLARRGGRGQGHLWACALLLFLVGITVVVVGRSDPTTMNLYCFGWQADCAPLAQTPFVALVDALEGHVQQGTFYVIHQRHMTSGVEKALGEQTSSELRRDDALEMVNIQ